MGNLHTIVIGKNKSDSMLDPFSFFSSFTFVYYCFCYKLITKRYYLY